MSPKDQNNRYSDEALNPAAEDFEEKINRSQGEDAINHDDAPVHDLRRSEEGLGPIQRQLQRRDNKQQAIRDAEGKDWNNPENKFYRPTEKIQNRISNWSTKRKGIAAGGIASVITLISLSLMLLPLKIPGLMQLVTQETAQKVEQITEKRAKVVIGRAILTKFGTHTGIVITGEGAFATLISSMRTSGFEKRLAAKGLVITPTSDGVRLTQNGKPLGGGKSLKNEQAVMDALENNKVTNKMIKDLVKEDIPTWRWMKRAKFSKWLRIKYGIPRYGLVNSDKETAEEKKKDMDTARVTAANQRTSTNFRQLIGCLVSGTCDKVDGSGEPSEADADAEKAGDDLDQLAEAQEKSVEDGSIKNLQTSLNKQLLDKFATKAIPIIGWIDLFATIDHLLWETGKEDYIGKIAAYFKGAAYVAIYADWSGYGSQIQLGEMDPEYVGVLAAELDNIEMGEAFQAIDGNDTKGVPITTMVNSDRPSEIKKFFDKYIAVGPYKIVGHPVMNAYYQTVGGGGLTGWLAGIAGDGISKLLGPFQNLLGAAIGAITPENVENKVKDTFAEFGKWMLEIMGLTIDNFDKGPALGNNIIGGGVVATNDYCKEIGCRKLSTQQAYEQHQTIAAERAEELREKGPIYALFSPDAAKSVTNRMAIAMPSGVGEVGTTIGSVLSSIPSKIANIVVPRSDAATGAKYEKLFGVQAYGATAADLNKPLDKNVENDEDCPEVSEDGYNACNIDKVVVEAMLCEFEPTSADCDPEAGTSLSSGAGGTVRVATFNMRGASHTGGNFAGRMDLSINLMKKQGFEVIGAQELQKPQRNYLMQKMAAVYDIFPCAKCDNERHSVENSILWDRSRYKLVKSGYIPGGVKYFGGSNLNAPWVLLEDTSNGQQIYILNTHDPAFPENAVHRYNNGKLHAKFMNELAATGLPVVMTGDFNSGYSAKTSGGNVTYQRKHENTIYCTMLSAGIGDVLDLSEKRTPKCPGNSKGYGNPIDHIFVSKGLDATNYTKVPGGYTNNGSDHPTYFADVLIPGAEGSGAGAEGWTWPIAKAKWPKSSMPVSECGLMYSSGTVHTGIDISVPTGTPLLAATAGEVVYTGGGYGMVTIKSSKLVGGSPVFVNYQHMSKINVKKGSKVTAGQPIGESGAVGAPQGAHLHFSTWKVSMLSGHTSPSSAAGKATLSKMYHPMTFMPKDERNLSECKEPYVLPK